MPANYAKATAAFLPAGEPKPDPAFLDGLQPANRKIAPTHHSKLDSASNGAGAELTPPLTPPSESDNAQDEKELGAEKGTRTATEAGGLKQRKSANKSNGDDAQKAGKKDKKEAPGAGFAQSIKGTVSEERYVPTDLDERIAQPCKPIRRFSCVTCSQVGGLTFRSIVRLQGFPVPTLLRPPSIRTEPRRATMLS